MSFPHFTVTRYIIQHGRLPDTAAEHESFQPPLYYLLSAALTFWIDTSDFVVKADADYDPFAPDAPKTLLLHTRAEWFPYQGWALAWHLMRLLSLAMGAVTIGAIGATVSTLTADRRLGLWCAALVAALPGFIFMAALVSNDNLAAMLAALLCWRIAVLLRPVSPDAPYTSPGVPSTLLLAGGRATSRPRGNAADGGSAAGLAAWPCTPFQDEHAGIRGNVGCRAPVCRVPAAMDVAIVAACQRARVRLRAGAERMVFRAQLPSVRGLARVAAGLGGE